MSVNSILSRTLHNAAISLLLFCLEDLSIFDSGVLKSPTIIAVSYTHLTLPTIVEWCRSRWSPYH